MSTPTAPPLIELYVNCNPVSKEVDAGGDGGITLRGLLHRLHAQALVVVPVPVYGSTIFGAKHTCPVMVRVLYYLDDLTPDVSPFRVIPRSHLSMHSDANPYHRYEGHPEEVMVTAKAGSAVLINYKVFHGNYPNRGGRAREMLALAYRPAWAGPLADVEDWDRDEVAKLPPAVRNYLGDRNTRRADIDVGNKPPNMRYEAPGIDPSRWSRT